MTNGDVELLATKTMSTEKLKKALALIQLHEEEADFEGVTQAEILRAELALGLVFPESYKIFLEQCGAGSFGGFEIYGIIAGNFEGEGIPNGVWYTLEERKRGLPENLIALTSDGMGGIDCLQVGHDGSNSGVVSFRNGQIDCKLTDDFGTYFFEHIEEEVED